MDEAKLTSLRTYYESLSDKALRAEAKLGRAAFEAEAWAIISQQIELRGLRSGHTHRQHRESHPDAPVADPEVKKEFARRRRRQNVLGVILTPFFFVGIGLKAVKNSVHGTAPLVAVLTILAVMVLGLAFSHWNWRCPKCSTFLGSRMGPRRCPHCGVRLAD